MFYNLKFVGGAQPEKKRGEVGNMLGRRGWRTPQEGVEVPDPGM